MPGSRNTQRLPIEEKTIIDVHAHLIPGVDDGAEEMTMALTMMLRAQDQGICCSFIHDSDPP